MPMPQITIQPDLVHICKSLNHEHFSADRQGSTSISVCWIFRGVAAGKRTPMVKVRY